MEDIKRITREEIGASYKTYYMPNNAVLVAVGDFKAPDVLAKIRAKFGRIPKGPPPPAVLAGEPPQNRERPGDNRKEGRPPHGSVSPPRAEPKRPRPVPSPDD